MLTSRELIALFLSEENINMTKTAGVALGFLGVLHIAHPWSNSGAIDIPGVVCMLVGSAAAGFTYIPPVVALVRKRV